MEPLTSVNLIHTWSCLANTQVHYAKLTLNANLIAAWKAYARVRLLKKNAMIILIAKRDFSVPMKISAESN